MSSFYRTFILWALHQGLGTKRGDAAYAQFVPIIALAESGALDTPGS